jgi:hypothetical protein
MWIHGHPPRQNEAMSGGKPGSVNPGPLALCAKDVSSYETSVSRKFGRMMKSTIFSKEFFWAGNSGIEKKSWDRLFSGKHHVLNSVVNLLSSFASFPGIVCPCVAFAK